MTNLLDFPPELLLHIFAYLPLTSLRGLLATSKGLNNLISTSVLLQYILHLESSAHSLYPSVSPTSLTDRLKVLTDAERRWQDWDYTSFNRLGVQHRPSGIYDLTSGIFILGEGSTLGRLTVGLRWADLRLGKDLVWYRFDLQTPIVDLGLNVLEWDLIAVVSMCVNYFHLDYGVRGMLTERCRRLGNPGFCQLDMNLLQLSKSRDSVATHHPKAKRPVIPIMQYPFEDGHCSIAIEIVGPYLALLVVFPGNRDSPDRLWVFEWQTGNVKFVSQRTICPVLSVYLLGYRHTGTLVAMDDIQLARILERRHSHLTQPPRLCHRTMLFHTKTRLDPGSCLAT